MFDPLRFGDSAVNHSAPSPAGADRSNSTQVSEMSARGEGDGVFSGLASPSNTNATAEPFHPVRARRGIAYSHDFRGVEESQHLLRPASGVTS